MNSIAGKPFAAPAVLRQASGVLLSGIVLLAMFLPRALSAQSSVSSTPPPAVSAQQRKQAGLREERREEIRQRKIDNPEAEDGVNVYRHSPMVHTLAHTFGLSVETTSRMFEVINFILLLVLIVWFVARLLPKALRARTERIRTEVEQARIATEDANRRLASVEERLSRLNGEIDAIRLQAAEETAQEEERLRAAAERERQLILNAATQEIQAATKNAQNQLRKLATDLVIEHAKRQIAVSPETDRTLVSGFVSGLNEKKSGKGVN